MSNKNKIYFIQDLKTGLVKIGKSNNPKLRLKTLQTGSSSELKLLKTIPGGIYLEQILHKYFNHIRKKGEWFMLDSELKAFINNSRQISISSVIEVTYDVLSKNELLFITNLEKTRLYL